MTIKLFNVIKVLVIFPCIIVGYAIGFIWEGIFVGVCAGQACINKIGTDAIERNKKK